VNSDLDAVINAEKILNIMRIRLDPDMAFVRRDASVAKFDKYTVPDLAKFAIHYLAPVLAS
jgi:hypothetical protein